MRAFHSFPPPISVSDSSFRSGRKAFRNSTQNDGKFSPRVQTEGLDTHVVGEISFHGGRWVMPQSYGGARLFPSAQWNCCHARARSNPQFGREGNIEGLAFGSASGRAVPQSHI